MVCESLSSMECSVLLASQQNVKLIFFVFFYLVFIFVWYYFNQKTIDKLKLQYLVWPVLTAKWTGFFYFLLSPVHILLLQGNLDYDIILGWYALFYIPTVTVTMLMPILMAFDKLFQYMGYKNTFEFIKKYREGLI